MPRLIVFDLDGTLIDSRRDLADSANDALIAFGAPPLAEEAIGRMVGDGAPILIARAFLASGVVQPAGALGSFLAAYDRRLLNHTRPYPGIVEVLDELESRASLGVLTNKPLDATRKILEGLDLARHFSPSRVIGGDGPFPRKPDPSGLLHLMRNDGVERDATVLVGDSLTDWKTAQSAAVPICLARYGFGWQGAPSDLPSANAWVVDRPAELLQYL
jgi:phosphoglycolate phosphatase